MPAVFQGVTSVTPFGSRLVVRRVRRAAMTIDLSQFRLLQDLGEGAAGTVHLATPKHSLPYARPGDPLAIKQYKREMLRREGQIRRMAQEFAVGTAVDHPNVVRMYDSDLEGNEPFLVMEYVDGVTLSHWVSMFHQIPGHVVLRLIRQLAEGLKSLHDDGVQHRDLKPANIMVSSTIDAKIMDLGVVRVTSEELQRRFGSNDETPTDQFLGTIRNSSPEMLLGKNYNERADIYSLGTILYALLHGYEVFADETHWVRLSHLVEEEDPQIDLGICSRDQICEALAELLPYLLAKDVKERLPTVDELLHLLEPIGELSRVSESFQPLHGYVATALTGLPEDSSEAMAFMSSAIADVAKGYGVYVYQPRRFTDPLLHSSVDPVLVYLTDRRRVSDTDVLFVVVNKPSFGVGQEIEIAASYGRPVILLVRSGVIISRMVTGSFSNIIDTVVYDSPESLERGIRRVLSTNIDFIRSAAAHRTGTRSELGSKIAGLRDAVGYETPAALAGACHVSTLTIEALENGRYENIGLVLLRRICDVLGVSLAEVVDSGVVTQLPDDVSGLRASLLNLESYARRTHLSAQDYFELRDDLRREIAASKGQFVVDEAGWSARRTALDTRNLNGSDGRLFGSEIG